MARRRPLSTQGSNAAALALAALLAAPAFAASDIDSRCDEVADASLEIPIHQLKTEIVSHDVAADAADASEVKAPSQFLAPQVEAALRSAFGDTTRPRAAAAASDSTDEPVAESSDGDERAMKMRLPGVTDSELERYRQQMYRIDI